MQNLSTVTGLEMHAPTGLATGSFQNILSEWIATSSSSSGGLRARASPSDRRARGEEGEELEVAVGPAHRYVHAGVLQGWSRQAQWMEEALGDLRARLGPRLHRVSVEARGRALGHFLWDRVSLEDVCVSPPLTEALTEGLAALHRHTETRPLKSLSLFLARRSEEVEEGRSVDGGEGAGLILQAGPAPSPEPAQMALDWRGAVVRELYHSEKQYQARLTAVLKVYYEPLTAAVDSNRPIISHASAHVILSPVEQILQLNRVFLRDLGPRLASWGPSQCVGDVCVKLCSKLRLYTTYLHQYPTALASVDTGDVPSVPGVPEESRQNSGYAYVKPPGAAARPLVAGGGIRPSAAGPLSPHGRRPPRPHTPGRRPAHPHPAPRVHT